MNVAKINSVKPSFTSNYEENKCNSGKWLGLGLSTGFIGANIFEKGGFKKFAQDYQDKVSSSLSDQYKQAGGSDLKIAEKDLLGPFKNMAYKNMFWTLAAVVGCCVGVGAIFDAIVNATKR